MKRKQLEALARCGFDIPLNAPTLSQLSISQIRQLRPSEESIQIEQERELIRNFPKNTDVEADAYGIRQFAGISFNKKDKPSIKEQSNANLNGYSELSSEQASISKGREKSLSFNKQLRKKRKSLKKPQRNKLSAGSVIKQQIDKTYQMEKIKKVAGQIKTSPTPFPLKIAKNNQIFLKLPRSQLKINLYESPLYLQGRGKQKEEVINPYYLRPDDIKFEINDINSEFSLPNNFMGESRMEKSAHFFREGKSSRQNPLNHSDSTNGFSEDYQTMPQLMRNLSKSEKVIEVKRQKSFDFSRQSFLSQKGVDSPFSRDSNSTTANGVNSSNRTKYGSEYYTDFKRVSK